VRGGGRRRRWPRLTRLYDVPIYAVGLLPTPAESEPDEPGKADSPRTAGDDPADRPPKRPLAEKNAARTLDALSDRCAAIVPFDNDDWLRPGETLVDARDRLNGVVAERIAPRCSAPARPMTRPRRPSRCSTRATLLGPSATTGRSPPLATRRRRSSRPSRDRGSGSGCSAPRSRQRWTRAPRCRRSRRRSGRRARGKNTVEVPDGRADRTLLVVGGPPAWLNREAIADGRRWLADETGSGAILTGDAPSRAATRCSRWWCGRGRRRVDPIRGDPGVDRVRRVSDISPFCPRPELVNRVRCPGRP